MKALFFSLILAASTSFAAEMVVIDVPAGHSKAHDSHSVKFVIDQETGNGSAVLSVDRKHEDCFYDSETGRDCTSWYSNLVSAKEVIVGIDVVDKKVTFEDRLDCGKMGVSRIFKVPTFFMTGNCTLSFERVKTNGEKRIVVKLLTKE